MRPLMIYDGDCAFCRRWVERWRSRTGDAVAFRPLQRRGFLGRLAVPRKAARRGAQLVDQGKRYEGADAVFRSLARAPRMRLIARIGRWPILRWFARRAYRFIATHRTAAGRVDRLVFGPSTAAPTRRVVRWLFLRALGGVYLIAFTSLRRQVLGLYGSRGIEPIGEWLAHLRAGAGRDAYRLAPSLLWLGSRDRDLVRLCRAGQACSAALMLGVAPRLMTVATWALYLSFVSVGRDFLSFQWDALLLETGLHAALASGRASAQDPSQPSWISAFLMRWLLFRLQFQSGLVKLQSRDPTWRRCTACAYHYETQPLPTRLGWYAFHLPRPVQVISTAAALGIELGAPFLVFAPRRLRKVGFSTMAGLQVLIAASGNYAFFNLLTVVLALWALDDESFERLPRAHRIDRRERMPSAWIRIAARLVHRTFAGLLAATSAVTFIERVSDRPLGKPMARLSRIIDPFRSINSYGLFAVMTTTRPEIVIEGSNDRREWREYLFRYKPSRLEDAPRFVAPHQPRLDWQMWFAALGRPPRWFPVLLARLLEGSPDVLNLLGRNPFSERPPRYVRAVLYEYRMTDLETKKRTGAWWQRKLIGTYFPACTLGEAVADASPARGSPRGGT
jgi:predicted DCC family thiol-disulfide oxidoreductase YuxK